MLALPAVASTAGPASASRPAAAAITDISKNCSGSDAEVEQAARGRHVYEEWMNCGAAGSIGFASSADGGRTWSPAITLPGSAGAWDPAVTVSPQGAVYASFMVSVTAGQDSYTYPVVDASGNDGATFTERARLNPKVNGNWGDRDFIAAGPHGVVYLTWDYGPSAADVTSICSPSGSCGYATGDLNVVIQKSTDYGRTWGPVIPVSPGFPASGGDSAPLVLERDGDIAIAYQGYRIRNTATYAMDPGYTYFTQSGDGGTTWSAPVRIGAAAGTMSLSEWWIDGAIGQDAAGGLYVTWDTRGATADTGWLSGPVMVSRQYGNTDVWPGDTFGISALPGGRLALSWGSAPGGSQDSAIWARWSRSRPAAKTSGSGGATWGVDASTETRAIPTHQATAATA